jgi:hypothetical protein
VRVKNNRRHSSADASVEAAWVAEIERRIAELDAGMVGTIPWHVVRDSLLRRLA